MNISQERYHRQLILQGFGEQAQSALAQSRVLIIGAGGLGCPALQYLCAVGVGAIGIIDDDQVCLSNLHRQILFSTPDIGRLKVEVAIEKLAQINPESSISGYPVKIDKSNIFDILKDYDYILDGSDNFATRYHVNDACTLFKKPLVFAAVSGYEGQLAVFNVVDGQQQRTNYRDIFPVQPENGEVLNCAENGVLGVLPGIIGTMAASEMIKVITKIGKPLINKMLHYNLLSGDQYEMNISPAQNYKRHESIDEILITAYQEVCQVLESYIEIDDKRLKLILSDPNALVIDLREEQEYPKLNNETIQQSPMSSFELLLAQNIKQEHIVFICQHGQRSAKAAEAFHDKYGSSKKIYNLKGGLMKWGNIFNI